MVNVGYKQLEQASGSMAANNVWASKQHLSDLESPALRQAARLKLHYNTRFVLLEAKSKAVLNTWTELLVANGATHK